MDELFEALTLVQTQKVAAFPVVLVGVSFWSGLVDWMGEQMLLGGKISESDLNILVSDDIDEISAHLASAPMRPRRDTSDGRKLQCPARATRRLGGLPRMELQLGIEAEPHPRVPRSGTDGDMSGDAIAILLGVTDERSGQ